MLKKAQKTMVAALLALLVLLAACGASQVQISTADKNRQVTVQAGEQLVISLEGNPTTGYSWEVQDLDTSLLQQTGEPKFSSSNPNLVGSGGTQTLTFTALKAGTTTLTLVYHRPWEKGVPPLDTFSVTVTIE